MCLLALTALLPGLSMAALAAGDCAAGPGTARVLEVDPAGLEVGTKHFPQTLDLAEGEFVLTFDDGPSAGTTPMVLKALAAGCVRATFFLVGTRAAESPALVKRILAEGHGIGYHSQTHPMTLADLPYDKAVRDIERGIASVDRAAYGTATASPHFPFFRFPGFGSSPQLLAYVAGRNMGVFGADLWASDWEPMTPEVELELVLTRMAHAGRGIVLFHDTRLQTARMVPALLKAMKERGYRIVHVVARGVATAATPQ
ncbi:polysaccharide deacetylase family protein [Ancylobacter defluvii]|uniref:Chitooligosaccharide deacetylase n=1 Tax=Ancylobacter defluvii TaxID=1282440 RepID=A0A9W6NCB6_9HYPH|nr:polysaccharide deacetylase family protein [Ancylobacter defluvii]MBS7586237.1 polysaccharide deacetylase family protein [Ancylobacter defluvii]GLK85510.1 polysaccharide deacetylase [Ancylobacter defluvii]